LFDRLFIFAGLTQTSCAPAFSFFSTIRAYWLKAWRNSFYNPAMFNRVTILAESNPIIYFISQFGVIFPLLYVVSVNHSNSPAFLTGIIIPLVNGSYPFFVLVTASFFSCWNSGRFTFARLGTILIMMTPFLCKFFFTPFACKGWGNSAYSFARLGAVKTHRPYMRSKDFAAYFTSGLIARITKRFIVCLRYIINSALTAFEFIFSFFHGDIIPHLERFHTATGITPELID